MIYLNITLTGKGMQLHICGCVLMFYIHVFNKSNKVEYLVHINNLCTFFWSVEGIKFIELLLYSSSMKYKRHKCWLKYACDVTRRQVVSNIYIKLFNHIFCHLKHTVSTG